MTEREEYKRLWETAPILSVRHVSDHGQECLLVGDEWLQDHLTRLALHFFRGGAVYQQNKKEEENNG